MHDVYLVCNLMIYQYCIRLSMWPYNSGQSGSILEIYRESLFHLNVRAEDERYEVLGVV